MTTSSALPTLFGRATAVLGEHATLREIVDQLENVCRSSGDGGAQPAAHHAQLIEQFRNLLFKHFAAEEDPGYFGTLVKAMPALGGEISRLCMEHQVFRLEVQRLIELSGAANKRDEFGVRLASLLDRFREHERSENLLIQEYFLRDDGEGND